MKTAYESIVAIAATFFTFLFGAWDTPLTVLLVFVTLDYLTGIACGIAKKGEKGKHGLSSKIGFAGLLKKAAIMGIIVVAVHLDILLGSQWVIRSLTCYFYIANEGISVIENAALLGLPVPKKIVDVLSQIKDKGSSDNKDKNNEK